MPRKIKQEDRIIVNIPDYDGAGIYRIENIRSGRAYVGSSVNIHTRILAHDKNMRKGLCNIRFLEDVKNGDKFTVTILEKMGVPTRHELYERENYYIQKENLYSVGYNTAGVHDYDLELIKQSPVYDYMNERMISVSKAKRK